MIYAMSDIHGCFGKYHEMLDKIKFSSDDVLYVLGDCVDRGSDGIAVLLDIMKRPNVAALKGNHDFSAMYYLDSYIEKGDKSKETLFHAWLSDGGAPTYESYMKLDRKERNAIICFLSSMKLKSEIEAGGRTYHLSHSVPEKYKFDLGTVKAKDYLIGEPEYEISYSKDYYTVTGHTPTFLIDKECDGRIFRKNNHIALDCGAIFGRTLGCICLDTLEEFYV